MASVRSRTLAITVDISGKNPSLSVGRSILGRTLRRVDAMARWQGCTLDSEETRFVIRKMDGLSIDDTALASAQYFSPNRHQEKRSKDVRVGALKLGGDVAPVLPILAMAQRCHIGRGTVEGLGRFEISC